MRAPRGRAPASWPEDRRVWRGAWPGDVAVGAAVEPGIHPHNAAKLLRLWSPFLLAHADTMPAMPRPAVCSAKTGIGPDRAAAVYNSLFKRRMAGGRAVV